MLWFRVSWPLRELYRPIMDAAIKATNTRYESFWYKENTSIGIKMEPNLPIPEQKAKPFDRSLVEKDSVVYG